VDSSNMTERLRAQVEYPEAWMPERGETLIGEAVAWETVEREDQPAGTLAALQAGERTPPTCTPFTAHSKPKPASPRACCDVAPLRGRDGGYPPNVGVMPGPAGVARERP
jgi:hypothetical protein